MYIYVVDMSSIYKGKSTRSRRLLIEEVEPPQFLYFGDSHIGRLFNWSQMREDGCGPDFWEYRLLQKCEYIYSGGSRWCNVLKRVRGIDVPLHQTQGDTWGDMMTRFLDGRFQPTHIFVSCSGNDICQINDSYFCKIRLSKIWHLLIDVPFGPSEFHKKKQLWFDDRVIVPKKVTDFNHEEFLENELQTIKNNIDNVMLVLTMYFPKCKIFALGALRRKHWFPEMNELLAKVNMYLRIKHAVTICNIGKFVRYWHLERDWIHLNKEGYKLLMSKAIGSVFDSYYAMVKPAQKFDVPADWNNMSQPQRRRYIKRQKKLALKCHTPYYIYCLYCIYTLMATTSLITCTVNELIQ